MPKEAYIAIIITIPFLGTTLGALMVYFLKKELNPRLKKALMGFAGGVMVSASSFHCYYLVWNYRGDWAIFPSCPPSWALPSGSG